MPAADRAFSRGDALVIASHNEGKVREIGELIAPFGVSVRSAGSLGLPSPEETGSTFEENARLKAVAAATGSGMIALADDSGLVVDALGGAPGIYSARWAPEGDFDKAMAEVERRLQAAGAVRPEQRTARFVAVLSLAWPDGASEEYRGEVEGHLVWPPRGTQGFGYDPIFLPEGHIHTFGEMSAEAKHGWKPGEDNALSHRARAFSLFANARLLGW